MRDKIVRIREWTEEKLRHLCGRITPEKRLAVLLAMFVLFSATSIYVLVSAIYRIGKDDGQRIEIEHIQQLKLQKDSINQLNINDYGGE